MSLPILYTKNGCPWCIDALEYFNKANLKLNVIDVLREPSKINELLACSGQTKTPTLKNGDFVVADFDIDEFKQAMLENPTQAKELGF
jgi:glutaredoxin